jgi:hypothetical protein
MTNSGLLALFLAISLSAGAQKPAPVPGAASDQDLARVCAQILRAAQQRDFALLIPVLDDPVEINFHEQLTRRGLKALVELWPEDFGPPFWRDLSDAVKSGIESIEDGFGAVAPPGRRQSQMGVYFQKIDGGWKVDRIIPGAAPKAHTKFLPVDVAMSDPGLAAVRAQIVRAVERRDVNLLLPILGPQVSLDTEVAYTPAQLVAHQKACMSDGCGDFWRQLHDAISLGMAWEADGDSVIAPYTIVKMSDERLNPYEVFAITGDRVALHAAPAVDAPTIEWLSFDLVAVSEASDSQDDSRPLRIGGFDYGWRRIVAPSGKTGWVSEKYASGGDGGFLAFKKLNGKWKLMVIGGQD